MATLGNITFHADDPRTLSHFWSGVLGYPLLEWLGARVVRLVDQSWGEWPELDSQLKDPEGYEFCLQ